MGIRERILARRDLDDLRAARELDGLAAALNAEGVTAPAERWVTARTILKECGDLGEPILAALEAAASEGSIATQWVLRFLGSDPGVDMGEESTRTKTDGLVAAGRLTAAQGDALKALSLRPVIVSRSEVFEAMFNNDGSEK